MNSRESLVRLAVDSALREGDCTGMTVQDWSAIADIVTSILTLIGIMTSMYLSIRALREIQKDRRIRQAPHLAFETGGFRVPIEFVKAGRRIPGLDPSFVESQFPEMPKDSESIRPAHQRNEDGSMLLINYGLLTNHGLGPAFETRVNWFPTEIRIGSETFEIDERKRSEPRYNPMLNRTLPSHRNIDPGQSANLIWLPVFIEKDFERKIDEVVGDIEISCHDVFGAELMWKQSFYIETGYTEDHPYVHVTFGESDETMSLIAA